MNNSIVIEDMKHGITKDVLGCNGIISGTSIVGLKIKENEETHKYIYILNVAGIYVFTLYDKDMFDRIFNEEESDEIYSGEIDSYEGIDLTADYLEYKIAADNSNAAKLIKLLLKLVDMNPEDLEKIKNDLIGVNVGEYFPNM